jgi:hypothetical protein
MYCQRQICMKRSRVYQSYDNPETGEASILILNEALWMGDKMDHTLVNPNQLCAYALTVQDNPFSEAPIFIATEGHEFILPLTSSGTILGGTTRKLTEAKLQLCPHISLSSKYEWDPQNVCFPKALPTVEEEVSRIVGAVWTQAEEYGYNDLETDTENQLLDIGKMSQRLIASVKVASIPRAVSQIEVQDIPQLKTFQSKGRHSSVSPEAFK